MVCCVQGISRKLHCIAADAALAVLAGTAAEVAANQGYESAVNVTSNSAAAAAAAATAAAAAAAVIITTAAGTAARPARGSTGSGTRRCAGQAAGRQQQQQQQVQATQHLSSSMPRGCTEHELLSVKLSTVKLVIDAAAEPLL
jgi:hypothetical protein